VLGLAATRPALPLPAALAPELDGSTVVEGPDAAEVLKAFDLVVTTMGRGPADDPAFFAAASAAGEWAAGAVRRPENPDH